MKIAIYSLILGFFLIPKSEALEMSTFDILPGRFHKGGTLIAKPEADGNPDRFVISLAYEIIKRDLVPVPSQYLSGTYEQALPPQFKDEQGYLGLEAVKTLKIDEATVVHLGRVSVRGVNDGHSIQIIPDNHRSDLFLVYSPQVPGMGWDRLKIILHTGVPLLGDYSIEGRLRLP